MARYEQIRRLGGGAFGEVHLARDSHTNTYVALKILLDPTDTERFVREAKILIEEAGNRHVVRILGAYFQCPRPFLVLEYCDQGSLVDWVTNRRSWQEAAVALAHVMAGLMPLHARGGFHRDLKPGNLLVTTATDGLIVKVADFGLARRPQTGPAGMTRTGWGTDGYVAPEIMKRAPFEWRSDMYSLGVVALELLTGTARPENLDAVQIPPALRLLVQRMLSQEPTNRPSAHECFTTLLDVVNADAKLSAAPAQPESSGPTFGEALFGGLLTGAALLGLVALFAGDDPPEKSQKKAPAKRRPAAS